MCNNHITVSPSECIELPYCTRNASNAKRVFSRRVKECHGLKVICFHTILGLKAVYYICKAKSISLKILGHVSATDRLSGLTHRIPRLALVIDGRAIEFHWNGEKFCLDVKDVERICRKLG